MRWCRSPATSTYWWSPGCSGQELSENMSALACNRLLVCVYCQGRWHVTLDEGHPADMGLSTELILLGWGPRSKTWSLPYLFPEWSRSCYDARALIVLLVVDISSILTLHLLFSVSGTWLLLASVDGIQNSCWRWNSYISAAGLPKRYEKIWSCTI